MQHVSIKFVKQQQNTNTFFFFFFLTNFCIFFFFYCMFEKDFGSFVFCLKDKNSVL